MGDGAGNPVYTFTLMKVAKQTKFYTFNQCNSGGSYDRIQGRVAEYVVVEADSVREANATARSLGIYFDGVAEGIDCECCGDRWSEADEYDGEPVPEVYGVELVHGIYDRGRFFDWLVQAHSGGSIPGFIRYRDGSVLDIICRTEPRPMMALRRVMQIVRRAI